VRFAPFPIDGLLTRRFPPNGALRALRRSTVVTLGTFIILPGCTDVDSVLSTDCWYVSLAARRRASHPRFLPECTQRLAGSKPLLLEIESSHRWQ